MKVRVAVHQALRENGMNILYAARAFREAVCSGLDDESTESKLLATCSDDEFVRSFSTAVEARSSDDLVEASECATRHLVKAYALDVEVAASVASGVYAGCADFLGLKLKEASTVKRARLGNALRSTTAIGSKGAS